MYKRKLLILLFIVGCANLSFAQDSTNFYFTTAVGVFSPVSSFASAYKKSLALNSGIEYRLSKNYFMQFVLDLNAVNYDQQIKDESSSYLFRHTSSSIFLAGLNAGRNISLEKNGRLFISPYLGFGYANIGEPRLSVKENSGIIEQEVKRMTGIYARQGVRIGYTTPSKILQTLYLDLSYLSANIHVQGSKPRALSILAGTRFGF